MTPAAATALTVTFVPQPRRRSDGRSPTRQVELLLDEGWMPEHIALLTTGHRHPVQVERTGPGDGQRRLLAELLGGRRRLLRPRSRLQGTRAARRGALRQRGAVRDRARERLYVGMSRATDALVVVGDPELIREVGGEQVARQLGL